MKVFTVRSVGQIGKFPNNDSERMFELLEEGLRAGYTHLLHNHLYTCTDTSMRRRCEWIDVEACWSQDLIESLTTKAVQDYRSTSR